MLIWLALAIVAAVIAGLLVWFATTDFEVGASVAIIVGVVLCFIWALVIAGIQLRIDAQCKAAGWREGNYVLLTNTRYCITRSDQTDIIKPLDEALRNPR